LVFWSNDLNFLGGRPHGFPHEELLLKNRTLFFLRALALHPERLEQGASRQKGLSFLGSVSHSIAWAGGILLA